MSFKEDSKGILFSTDFILSFILFILVMGTIVNLIDESSDRTINSLETSKLKKLTIEVVDNLINNPGTPKHWEKLSDFNMINPGLAIENEFNSTIINTISFEKLKILENGEYSNLIGNKFFNEKIKSSISIYPIYCNITPIVIGDTVENSFENLSNIISVNRIVKCDFYRKFVLVDLFDINKENMEYGYNSYVPYNNILSFENNKNNINKKSLCNHETIAELNHSNNNSYMWICKEFKINKKDIDEKNFYLIFDDNCINNGNFWILDNFKEISNDEKIIDRDKINLNEYFNEYFNGYFEDTTSMTFYFHVKINIHNLDQYNSVLVGLPKDVSIDDLNIDHFKEQDCKFIMRTYYG